MTENFWDSWVRDSKGISAIPTGHLPYGLDCARRIVRTDSFEFPETYDSNGYIMPMTYIQLAQAHLMELYPLIAYGHPRLSDLIPGTIIGTWQISVPNKVRFILDAGMELAIGTMPGDVARAWIRDQYVLPIKRRKNQMEKSYNVPLYARRGHWGECSYIDIKGAYLRVLHLGYDLEYVRGKYISAHPRSIPDEIKKSKFTYSTAVAMSHKARASIPMVGKEHFFTHEPLNIFSNPCLWNVAQDTLCGIGSEMLRVLGKHVFYANTDGYVIEAGYEQVAFDVIESWGFHAAIKHQGQTEIRGVARYRIGDFQTKAFDMQPRDWCSTMMDRDTTRWLKTQWSIWGGKIDETH